MEPINLDRIKHDLTLCGMAAYCKIILDLTAAFNELQARVEQLQNRLDRETASVTVPARTATEHQTFSWCPGDVWDQYCATVDPASISRSGSDL